MLSSSVEYLGHPAVVVASERFSLEETSSNRFSSGDSLSSQLRGRQGKELHLIFINIGPVSETCRLLRDSIALGYGQLGNKLWLQFHQSIRHVAMGS